MQIDSDWCWLMQIDSDWCWLMLRNAREWHKSERTHVPWTSIFYTGIQRLIWQILHKFTNVLGTFLKRYWLNNHFLLKVTTIVWNTLLRWSFGLIYIPKNRRMRCKDGILDRALWHCCALIKSYRKSADVSTLQTSESWNWNLCWCTTIQFIGWLDSTSAGEMLWEQRGKINDSANFGEFAKCTLWNFWYHINQREYFIFSNYFHSTFL